MSANYRFDQAGYTFSREWGLGGIQTLVAACAVLIIVDVLSFSSPVSLATDQGAVVSSFARRDE